MLVMEEYNANWDKVSGIDVYLHKTKELAIVETMESKWIVLADKSNPVIEAVYDSFEDAFDEWSHA